MSNVERLRLPTPEEGVQNQRATTTESFHRASRTGGQSINNLPTFLRMALEVEAWKERPSPLGKIISNPSFSDWLKRPFPQGVDADPALVRRILADDVEALVLFDRAIEGTPGNPSGVNQHTKTEGGGTVYNVNSSSEGRPVGNSVNQGLRRLRKAAEAGDERAAELLREVTTPDPEKPKGHLRSVHSACQKMGWRPKIDKDVQQRAARALAEWIVAHAGQDDLSAVKADLFACGAKALAMELTNLLGEPIMGRRYRKRDR
jgi:hypothetical protein